MLPGSRHVTRTAVLAATAAVLAISPAPVATQQLRDQIPAAEYRGVTTAVRFDVSPPLRDLALRAPAVAPQEEDARAEDPPSGLEGPLGPQGRDAALQTRAVDGAVRMPSPLQNFDGMSQSSGPYPPDTVGDVGPNHYVQMVNSRFAVYGKTGTLLAGPMNINTLWAGFGGACQTENAGDPIVLYDQFADRWLVTQFTAAGPTYYNCVALSTGPDPTSTYYRWAFTTGTNFPDYPKYGIWSDAYYISTREFLSSGPFAGIGAYALNKTQMLAGNPSPQIISFLATPSPAWSTGDGLLPADIDGSTLPPAGTPEFYIGTRDNGGPYAAPSDALVLWKFTVNFTTPASSSFVADSTVAVAEFDSMLSACSGRNCVPQPGTAQKLDHQGYRQRPLHRAAYRNFGTHQSIVTNQSVEASAGMSGIRWWELRSPNASPTVYQEGTYAPGTVDGIHRWFGSVAQDQSGNMALGYSVSDGTSTYPGVRYTGRLAGDTLGTMPQGEVTLVAGGGSQTGTAARWGDYSSMNVDPTDDCTFWYTTEYYATTSVAGWKTRIGSFKFPGCGAAAPSITVHPSNQTVQAGQVASFFATASGLPSPTLQWQSSRNGGGRWADIGGATSTSYGFTATTADDTFQYRAVFTNIYGTATTDPATLTVQSGPGSPLLFADHPLQAGQTDVGRIHILQLRDRIAELRARYTLGPATWTDASIVAGATVIKAAHLVELRNALDQVYVAAGRAVPVYASGAVVSGTTPITAAQVMELRAAILAIW